jgi:hypothetical protein
MGGRANEMARSVAEALFADGDTDWQSRPRLILQLQHAQQKSEGDGYCGSWYTVIPPSERLQAGVRQVTVQ